jgi:hypothetical protein
VLVTNIDVMTLEMAEMASGFSPCQFEPIP